MDNSKIISLVRETVLAFCQEFVEHPYLCYTEHGQHAWFYTKLYLALPEERRYLDWQGNRVCTVQKEYPTAGSLGKSKRQHWDIAVLQEPAETILEGSGAFDYLKLTAVVEFGMNEGEEHLLDDLLRMNHHEANFQQGFAVHLYRLSEPGRPMSGRDWSPNSPRILKAEDIRWLSIDRPVEIYLAIHDSTGKQSTGLWQIIDGLVERLD